MQDGGSLIAGTGVGTVAEMIEELGAAVEGVCAGWQERADDGPHATFGQVLSRMVKGLVAGGGCGSGSAASWGRAVSMAAQRAVQPAGVAFIQGAPKKSPPGPGRTALETLLCLLRPTSPGA